MANGSGQKVCIHGNGPYNRGQSIQRTETTEKFQLPGPSDAAHRPNELRYIEDGWMEDGSGIAPDKSAIKKLSRLFDEYYRSGNVMPHIYPTPSGNIEMEWIFGGRGFLLKVDLSTFMAEMTDTDRYDTTEFDLSSAHGWTLLNDLLKGAAANG